MLASVLALACASPKSGAPEAEAQSAPASAAAERAPADDRPGAAKDGYVNEEAEAEAMGERQADDAAVAAPAGTDRE